MAHQDAVPPDMPPRHEFRAWAEDFGAVRDRLAAVARAARDEAPREEFYLLPAADSPHNVKIRSGTLDIKTRLAEAGGLELWRPTLKASFPLPAGVIADRILPALDLAAPGLRRSRYTAAQFLDEVMAPNPDVAVARVTKRRRRYDFDGAQAEVARVAIGALACETIAVESEDADRVRALVVELGLDGFTNVDYPRAIRSMLRGALPPSDCRR